MKRQLAFELVIVITQECVNALFPSRPFSPSSESAFALQADEKMKYDLIFESLSPSNGMLSGEKVKPVLLNSKLPVDVLGRVRG